MSVRRRAAANDAAEGFEPGLRGQPRLVNGQIGVGTGMRAVCSAWQFVGTGDYNGDGTSDVLWRNTAIGEVDTWVVSNGHIVGGSPIGSVSTAWAASSGGSAVATSNQASSQITIDNGSTVELRPSAADVTFAGPTGALKLDQSASFSGTISGFSGQDQVDLADIAFGSQTTLGYSENANSDPADLRSARRYYRQS